MSCERSLSDITVSDLKDILRELGASTVGVKAELISRILEIDPTGDRTSHVLTKRNERQNESSASANFREADEESTLLRREMEVYWREKELLERELQLARREIDLMRMTQNARTNGHDFGAVSPSVSHASVGRPSLNIVADSLSHFDGSNNLYEAWEKRVKSLRNAYELTDDLTRLMIGARLKGKAQEWFHSDPSYSDLPVDELLNEMRAMFFHEPSRIQTRKQFEQRMWQRGETFCEYLHQKVILGNRVKIEEAEMIEYIIKGIPEPILRDQARIQRLRTKSSLLEAFERVTLRPRNLCSRDQDAREQRNSVNDKRNVAQVKRCHNCGVQGHLAMECPSKSRGAKCFGCGEFGHIAAKCLKNKNAVREIGVVSRSSHNSKYCKDVKLRGKKIVALIDTGSDLSLMREDEYRRLQFPEMTQQEIVFRGVGSENYKTIGKIDGEIEIDDEYFTISIFVVPSSVIQHALLIGTDFLNKIELNIREGRISIKKPRAGLETSGEIPEIFNIETIEKPKPQDDKYRAINDIHSEQSRSSVKEIVEQYCPQEIKKIGVELSLILKDDDPVCDRPRRLAPCDKRLVDEHIYDWLRKDIVKPSTSEYASPVVLVKKRTTELDFVMTLEN
ncbi:uncharacterized protein LOC109861499 [Pseudomyrmex gracilis]|uniref:uncharacterized protein LOC109861499 n=1 Tax=Pseudomyrmex gracilis TaxID=219809 RepID=UPI000995126D|nr:uncharacterized protein LOC109861499 [Pseudomyrmex gracilis]